MKESLMKEWNAHERNEDKEVEILDFNDKQKKKRRDKTKDKYKRGKVRAVSSDADTEKGKE